MCSALGLRLLETDAIVRCGLCKSALREPGLAKRGIELLYHIQWILCRSASFASNQTLGVRFDKVAFTGYVNESLDICHK